MNSLAINVGRLLKGSIAAQIISILAIPLLSRIYSPSAFGAYQALVSLLPILLVVSSLRIEIGILSEEDSKVFELMHAVVWLCAGINSLVAIVVIVLSLFHLRYGAFSAHWLILLPILGFVASINQALTYFSIRRQAFDDCANSKVTQSTGYVGAALSLGWAHASSLSLLVADIVGRALGCAQLMRRSGLSVHRLSGLPTFESMLSTLRRHRLLLFGGLGSALINASVPALTSTAMMVLLGQSSTGQYGMVDRAIGMPIAFLVGTMSQAFMGRFASGARGIDPRGFRRTIAGIAMLSAVPVIGLFAIGPRVFPAILGEGWGQAGEIARVLSPLYFVSLIVGPLNMVLTILGRQLQQLAWDIGRAVAVLGVWAYVWWKHLGAISAVTAYATVMTAASLIYLLIVDKAIREVWHAKQNV